MTDFLQLQVDLKAAQDENRIFRIKLKEYERLLKENNIAHTPTKEALSFDDIFENLSLKESSKNTYKKVWMRLSKLIFKKDIPVIADFANNQQEVCDFIWNTEKQPFNKIRMIYTPLKHNHFEVNHYRQKLKQLANTRYVHKEDKVRPECKEIQSPEKPKEEVKDEPNVWTWEKIIKFYGDLIEKPNKTHDEWISCICLGIAVEIAPQRANEIRCLKWENNGTNNYVDMEKKCVVIRQNKANHEPQTFPMNGKLHGLLESYVQYLLGAKLMHENVFVTQKGTEFKASGGGFQKCLLRTANCTLQMLRSLYVSDAVSTMSPEEKNEKAKQMFHSVPTQVLEYNRMEEIPQNE